jgi:hypothetical protein
MSWRKMLGVEELKPTNLPHNTHNMHKYPTNGNSAYCADIVERKSKMLEALALACNGLSITPNELYEALDSDDIENWFDNTISPLSLKDFAHSQLQRKLMDEGKVPEHFTLQGICKQCGPILSWFQGETESCPWCWNRLEDKPIPRPQSVQCMNCTHFKRTNHPALGHCARGEPEAIAGIWDTDFRYCLLFLPPKQHSR